MLFRSLNRGTRHHEAVVIVVLERLNGLIELHQMVGTLTNAITGKNIKPETAGRLAKILGVDVLEIIKTE